MRKGIFRGLLIGVVVLLAVLLYVWLRYSPHTAVEWRTQLSNSLFQIALLFLMIGVVIFTRLFSFRRRMGLVSYRGLAESKTKDDYDEFREEQARMNEQDKERLEEKGRDLTLLVTAIFLIVVSILLTLNQVH